MNRRELLGALGVASAHTLLWAFGCGGSAKRVSSGTPESRGGEVRTWLHDAVARLAGAGFAAPHALAVARRRTTAALDVLGTSVMRARCDGVVLVVRDRDGAHREQVTADLSADGIAAAVRALAAAAKPAHVAFGKPEVWRASGPPGDEPSDAELIGGLDKLRRGDGALTSRIVYRAEVIDIDDATVWSVSTAHDREQRLVRVRQSATRVAWNGTQPVVGEAGLAWLGSAGDHSLGKAELERATRDALALMTPGAFGDGEYTVVIEPSIVAQLIDATVQALLTTRAASRPEVAHRLAIGAAAASPQLSLHDDPTAGGRFDAYGSYRFDDAGEPAVPIALLDHGRVAGKLGERRRPGHVGCMEPQASHLRLEVSGAPAAIGDGFLVEGGLGALVDPASDRVVVSIARAHELRGGQETGRVFADIELVATLAALLASAGSVAKPAQMFGMRDELDGQPRWRSIEAPWLRAKGVLRARRRPV